MADPVTVSRMYDYHVWANEIVMDRLKELPEDIYHKEIQNGYSSVSKVLSHIFLVDYVWFEVISGKGMNEAKLTSDQLKEELEASSIEEMKRKFLDLSTRNKALLNVHTEVDKVIMVDNPYAGQLATSISETILHVVTHGSYHRGNIATMLRQIGHTSVMQDFGLYLYSNRTE